MDSEDVRPEDAVDRALRRVRDEGSVYCLERLLSEHRHDPGYVEKFYSALMQRKGECGGDIYEVFGSHFLQNRAYGRVTGVLVPWLEMVQKRYSVDECMRLFGYFNRAYEGMPEGVREGMYGQLLEMLLGLGWVLKSNGALYESYVVCEKVCGMITAMEKPSSKSTAISYLELLCNFFIESYMLFSYVNAVNLLVSLDAELIRGQCSLEDFRMICSYANLKNEGDKHRRLFCKIKFSDPKDIFGSVEKRCSGIYVPHDTLVRRRFDFGMWSRYSESVGRPVPVSENLDLVAFMKKNDLEFTVREEMVFAKGFDYKTVEKKVFEIIDEYKERAEPVLRRSVEKSRMPVIKPVAKKETTAPPKKTIKFSDRFSAPYKKMRMYSRYFMENTKGIEDVWYEKRNREMKEAFEKEENALRNRRKELKAYSEVVDEMRRELSKKIEENARKAEPSVPAPTKIRSTHWRSEPSEAAVYRPPNVSSNRGPRAYVPPSGGFRHVSGSQSPSRGPGAPEESNPFRRNRVLRSNSSCGNGKSEDSDKKGN